MKKRLSPKQAIEKECSRCKSGARFDCESKLCKLNEANTPSWEGWTSLKRIKAHCLDCVGIDKAGPELENCGGKEVLYPEPHFCALYEFRFGTNPGRKGIGKKGGAPENFVKKLRTHGEKGLSEQKMITHEMIRVRGTGKNQ